VRVEKMTITWERYVTRPATEKDLAEQADWLKETGRTMYDEDLKVGDEIEVEETVELPGKYEVCGRCQGKGTHTNPSIDGHGISQEEWFGPDWDDESREDYLSGAYDVSCHECDGRRVVLVLDEDACDKELLKQYLQWQEDKYRMDAEDRAIRYMESGGHDY
jgi:hypothetical protein